MTSNQSAPILDAFIASDAQWRVWCSYERKWHYHGKGDGHRVAHCVDESSPYHKTGYILRGTGLYLSVPAARKFCALLNSEHSLEFKISELIARLNSVKFKRYELEEAWGISLAPDGTHILPK